jgi:uncharacterized protein
MDVLRGVALFGVFLANLVGFGSANIMATEQQLLTLPTAAWDFTLRQLIEWLVFDKANTLFAFLFGLGFYLQMQRLEGRGVDFERIYLRRLLVLLVIGTIHLLFVWTWDILHLYALAGFVLFAMRDASNRDLLAIGTILALVGRTAQKTFAEFTTLASWTGSSSGYDDASVLVRQQLSESGDYLGIVRNFFDWVVIDYVSSALILGWLCYALGRFLIGAWVGRHGWIERARDYLPRWNRLAWWSLPLGLALEGAAVLLVESSLLPEWQHREYLGEMLHLVSVPVLAVGYVSALVTLFHSPRGARLLAPFAWSGRMALTNYLTQSLVIAFVLFGVGPGLALAGRVGTCALTAIVMVAYALQVVFSRWWLRQFAFGPAEWLWRALTYGTMPSMRLSRIEARTPSA